MRGRRSSFCGTICARGCFQEIRWREKERKNNTEEKKKKNTRDLHAFAVQISARIVHSRDERARESVLYRRRSPRVCRDVELARVFWFRRDFPRVTGDGEVGGGFPDGDDLRGKRARAGSAQPGAPPSLRSLLPLRDHARMEPSFSQVIGWMNRDRPAHVCVLTRRDAADVRPSVTATITELWSIELQNCRKRQRKLASDRQDGKLLPRNYNECFTRDILHSRRFIPRLIRNWSLLR